MTSNNISTLLAKFRKKVISDGIIPLANTDIKQQQKKYAFLSSTIQTKSSKKFMSAAESKNIS